MVLPREVCVVSRRGTERFARVVIAAQKSAEGIVAAVSGEGLNDGLPVPFLQFFFSEIKV